GAAAQSTGRREGSWRLHRVDERTRTGPAEADRRGRSCESIAGDGRAERRLRPPTEAVQLAVGRGWLGAPGPGRDYGTSPSAMAVSVCPAAASSLRAARSSPRTGPRLTMTMGIFRSQARS